jgi:hypothetical protein
MHEMLGYPVSPPQIDSSPSTLHTRSAVPSLQETGFDMKPYGPALQRLLPRIQLKKKYGMYSMVLNKPALSLLYPQGHIGEGHRLLAQRTDRAWIDQYESIDSHRC